jgi:hypothetical protein
MLIINGSLIAPITFQSKIAFAAETTPEEAWWLTATFIPNQTQYFSLQAREIDPSWTALLPLSIGALPKDAVSDFKWMKRDGFRFSWDGKSSDSQPVHIGTGVYKAQDGSTGRYLIVLQRDASNIWRVKLLYKESGDPGFSVLRITKFGIYWGTCMLCSDFRQIIVDGNSYQLR